MTHMVTDPQPDPQGSSFSVTIHALATVDKGKGLLIYAKQEHLYQMPLSRCHSGNPVNRNIFFVKMFSGA